MFEIIKSDHHKWAVIADGFDTGIEAMKYCDEVEEALDFIKKFDEAQAAVDAIDQSLIDKVKKEPLDFDTDLMDVETYNRLSELANLKQMSLKDTLRLCVFNEEHESPEMETREKVVVPAQ